jgi:hypothetical protein
VIAGHAFDSYVELLHNGNPVARAFGEAKNYELLSSHLETFNQWLEDANFKPDETPGDISFMIAPSCPPLLQRKLELKNIQFIKSDKVISTPTPIPTSIFTLIPPPTPINLNIADKSELTKAFQGTRIKQTTIDKLIGDRNTTIYRDIEDMAFRLKLTTAVKKKLQLKFDKGEISF